MDLAPTDVDDMFVDGLREQAENLAIPGFIPEDAGRLGQGFVYPGGKGIAGNVNAKKIRQLQEHREDEASRKKLQTEQEKTREVLRLKKELTEKENLKKRLAELEEETRRKEQAYREKYSLANKRR